MKNQQCSVVVRVMLSPLVSASRLTQHLSSEEVRRSTRFARDRRRDEFVTGAALLRLLVRNELGIDATTFPVERVCPDCGQSHGRPRLPARHGIQVSVAHAGGWVGVASSRQPVGIDIEQYEPRFVGLESSILSSNEIFRIGDQSIPDRTATLTTAWTRKEASLKALGIGLRVPLNSLEVIESSPLRAVGPALDGRGTIYLRDIAVDTLHVGAVAVRVDSPPCHIKMHTEFLDVEQALRH